MNVRRHVLFVLEYYYPHVGGVETLFKSLAESLVDQGHQVTVLTNRFDNSLAASVSLNGVTIRRFRFYNRYLFTFLAWIPAWRYAKQADVIHTTSYNAALPARLVAKLTGTASVITFHEYWGALWQKLPWISSIMATLFRVFERMISRFKFERFVAVSQFTHDALITAGVDAKRVITIHNGIDYNQFQQREKIANHVPFQFLFFGRPSFSKGIDLLIEAIEMAIDAELNCQFTLVLPSEKTPIYNEIMTTLRADAYQGKVVVLHDLSYAALKSEIASSDTVIIPSYSEGFCYAAVETMAIGTPIISSGRGALREVISGQYIEMEEHNARSLLSAIKLAISGDWKRTSKKEFKLEDTINAYLALYEDLLAE